MTACPTDALGRSICAQTLVDLSGAGSNGQPGCEITVSTLRPLVRGPYTVDGFVCPHGNEYWIEPTGEQIMAWGQAGVR